MVVSHFCWRFCLSPRLPSEDTDKLFPVIGFGGKLGPDQPANHAFAVNFQEDRPEVEGMAGVLQVTRRCSSACESSISIA